ncbi:hypothetical protein ABH931_007299 [Streptacidiphilus sp. MAP12-33]|uniref:hypothetical protein n=1 Tax=Streptacidiphilus sp. MAP12-33 TaxID=3156266 RepID=UPI0035169DF3
MISGMAAMGPDHGQLVPVRLVGGPADGRTVLHPHRPGTPLPDVVRYGPGPATGVYRRQTSRTADDRDSRSPDSPVPTYVWEDPAGERPH